MPNFTPGPWKKEAYNRSLGTLISYGDLSKGENIGIVFSTKDDSTGKANARLIAAAPAMYDALVIALALMDEGREYDFVQKVMSQAEGKL